ncbi:MAG TPA: trypsin-like peptidase domain-containing protein [Methylomirabilota bacterium]|nr:trypsin-like peptidase domain-containing protein [Methylomirabilota bacterium]
MRKLGWLVLIALGAAAAHAVMMPRSAADRSLDAAVASGTGFFVSADGVVLTAHHVVDGCAEIHLLSPLLGPAAARLLRAEPSLDVALLAAEVAAPAHLSLADAPKGIRPGDGSDRLRGGRAEHRPARDGDGPHRAAHAGARRLARA